MAGPSKKGNCMFRCFFVNRAWALWAWGGLLSMVVLVYVTVQQTVRLNS